MSSSVFHQSSENASSFNSAVQSVTRRFDRILSDTQACRSSVRASRTALLPPEKHLAEWAPSWSPVKGNGMGLSPHFLLCGVQMGKSVSEARYESFSAHAGPAPPGEQRQRGGNEIQLCRDVKVIHPLWRKKLLCRLGTRWVWSKGLFRSHEWKRIIQQGAGDGLTHSRLF